MKRISLFSVIFFLLFSFSICSAKENKNISDAEISKATDHFISLLQKTAYFDFVDSRIHGLPKLDNPQSHQSFWWGTYWSGVNVLKKDGVISYIHSADGADNNGLRTAAYLESACFAYALSKNPKYVPLIRKMVRGFSSWILSSEQVSKPDYPKMLLRAHYGENVLSEENGRKIYFDYSANRPGIDNRATQYVHLAENPTFGDIWIKNFRSRDDLGHMIKAIALLKSCDEFLGEDAQSDILQMRELYSQWSADADRNGFEIPTLDKNGDISKTHDSFIEKFLHALSPTAHYAIRLLHQDNPGFIKIINNDYFFESLLHKYLKNDVFEIVRSMDLAALAITYSKAESDDISKLQRRIKRRVRRDMKYYDGKLKANRFNKNDVPTLLINANNLGIDLKAKEIRLIYQKLREADLAMPHNDPTYHLFEASTPDGTYSYDPTNSTMEFRSIGLILGACSSKYKNEDARPIIDCERVKNYL